MSNSESKEMYEEVQMTPPVHFAVVDHRPIPPGTRNVPLCGTDEEMPSLTVDFRCVTCPKCSEHLKEQYEKSVP